MSLMLQQEMLRVQFHQHSQAQREINECLAHFSNLKAKASMFVKNDGSEEQRLSLKGTIPITHKGNNYHIPVQMWLDRNFPYSAPECFVDPSQDVAGTMRITKGKNVNASGKVTGDMFDNWRHDYGFLFLVQQLSSLFSVKPPVHSVTPQAAAAERQHLLQQQQQQQPRQQQQQQQQRPPYQPPSNYTSPHQTQTGYTPHYNPPPVQHDRPVNTPLQRADTKIDDNVLKRTVVSDLSSKTNRTLQKRIDSTTMRIRGLENTNAELNKNANSIKHYEVTLKTKSAESDSALEWYQTNSRTIQGVVDSLLKQQEHLNVDETVSGSCILHSQLIELEADEMAIDDTVHELQKGMRGRASDLHDFLDRMRVLSENKFDVMEKVKLAKEIAVTASGH